MKQKFHSKKFLQTFMVIKYKHPGFITHTFFFSVIKKFYPKTSVTCVCVFDYKDYKYFDTADRQVIIIYDMHVLCLIIIMCVCFSHFFTHLKITGKKSVITWKNWGEREKCHKKRINFFFLLKNRFPLIRINRFWWYKKILFKNRKTFFFDEIFPFAKSSLLINSLVFFLSKAKFFRFQKLTWKNRKIIIIIIKH